MKNFALAAAVLLVGCATTPVASDPDRIIKLMKQRSGEIAQRERRCLEGAMSQTRDEVARIRIAHEPFAEERTRIAEDEGERELGRCRAEADQEKEELSARERAEYGLRGDEERERSSLMMVLTTSRPR